MAIAFSSSGDSVMTRQITADSHLSFTNTAEEFSVTSTAMWISQNKIRRVRRTYIYAVRVKLWKDYFLGRIAVLRT